MWILNASKDSMSRFHPYRNVRPKLILFRGKTDKEGRLYVDFLNKPAVYNSNYEIAVDKLSMNGQGVNNVYGPHKINMMFTDDAGTDYDISLQDCRIVYVRHFINLLTDRLSIGGHHIIVEMDTIRSCLVLRFNRNKLTLPVYVGKILNLVTAGLEVTKLWKTANAAAVDMHIVGDDLVLDATQKDPANALTVPLDFNLNIWNEISKGSFQSILVHSDLVIREFVGSQFVNILANLTYDESEDSAFWDVYNHQWRRLATDRIRKAFVQFSDTQARPLVNVDCNLVCKLRHRVPF